MRTVILSFIAKISLLVSLIFTSILVYGQNSHLVLTSGLVAMHLEEYRIASRSIQGATSADLTNDMSIAEVPAISVLYVSPGPVGGDFKVKITASQKGDIRVRVLNRSGKLLKRIGVRRNEPIVFGSDLHPGNYIIEIIQGNIRKIQKLVKI